MTEQEWLTSDDVRCMAHFVAQRDGMTRRKSGRRKLRLFGCFSCRQLWERMTDERSRHAVEVAERLADDLATPAEVKQAEAGAIKARIRTARLPYGNMEYCEAMVAQGRLGQDERHAAAAAAAVLAPQWGNFAWAGLSYSYGPSLPEYPIYIARRRGQADALRCLFGNPFRPVAADPRWLAWGDGTLKRLAQTIYDERAWGQLPVLADALEDAGCTDDAILAHCRGAGPHTLGCWVVDLLLGKG